MEIERLSDNKVKFVLNKSDLSERDIKISELAYGSEKTQELFREMMLQAMIECDFHTENTPLMIEAIPVSAESIIIIVTKVTGSEDVESKFNFFAKQKESVRTEKKTQEGFGRGFRKKEFLPYENILIYSFESLDTLVNVSGRISSEYEGESNAYKYEGKYYLVLEDEGGTDERSDELLESVLAEYGQKHVSTTISKYFLIEHGEVFVKEDALYKLARYLG